MKKLERVKKGVLNRTFKDGKAKISAYSEDYVFLIAGLLDLFEATSEKYWLEQALQFDSILENKFEDKTSGGLFMTSVYHEKLLAREKPGEDGAIPSVNSVAALTLLRLYELTSQEPFKRRAENIFKSFSRTLNSEPTALSEMCVALDFYYDKPKEIVFVTVGKEKSDVEPFLKSLGQQFVPSRVVTSVSVGTELDALSSLIPLVRGKIPQHQKATAYVCERGVCQFPTTNPSVLSEQIRKVTQLN